MADPLASALGKVILGTTGKGVDWQTLRDHLEEAGWTVDLFDPSPDEEGQGPEAALPLLHDVDLAILLAREPDDDQETAANERQAQLLGQLERGLGPHKVLHLRERALAPLAEESAVTQLSFEPGGISAVFPDVLEMLAATSVPPQARPVFPWRERFGFAAGVAPARELLAILGAFSVLVMLLGITAALANDDAGSGQLTAEVAASPDLEGQTASEAVGSTETADSAPFIGDADAGGSVRGLPARCVIDTRRGVVVPETVTCQGIGGVRIEGFRGPWHNEFSTVEADLGVVAELFTEFGDNVDGVTLTPAAANDVPALGGDHVQQVVLVFTADGQQVTFAQRGADGGNTATLIFGIELG